MPELTITVNCKSMLISTAFFRFCKGIEHCYYTLLFTSEPYDRTGAKPWLSWLELGFHLFLPEALCRIKGKIWLAISVLAFPFGWSSAGVTQSEDSGP